MVKFQSQSQQLQIREKRILEFKSGKDQRPSSNTQKGFPLNSASVPRFSIDGKRLTHIRMEPETDHKDGVAVQTVHVCTAF